MLPELFLSEPFCNCRVSASATQRLDSLVTRKTIIDITGAFTGENILERLLIKITQRNITSVVETAGNNRTVDKHTNLIA